MAKRKKNVGMLEETEENSSFSVTVKLQCIVHTDLTALLLAILRLGTLALHIGTEMNGLRTGYEVAFDAPHRRRTPISLDNCTIA